MNKPASIVRFEPLWWAATAAWLIGTVLAWERTEKTLAANPQTAAAVGVAQPLSVAIVVVAAALLWWLAVRRRSVAGKGLVAVTAGLSGLQLLLRLFSLTGGAVHPLSLIAFLLGEALTIWSAVQLFRPDADRWFGQVEEEDLQ